MFSRHINHINIIIASGIATVTAVVLYSKQRKLRPQKGETQSNLKALGISIPTPPSPKGNYVPVVRSGEKLLHLCGHIPTTKSGEIITGKVGKELTKEEGYESARACAINILGTLSSELGGIEGLDQIKRIVKVVGFVNCVSDFTQQPFVVNGASDLFGDVFGKERGRHARSAVGTNSLPLNIPTEVECIVELY